MLNERVCVIGAGPSGLAAAKNLLSEGIANIVVYEMSDQVGGNWVYREENSQATTTTMTTTQHSSVCETTHIISSKRWSQYEDFPMPKDYPDYPSHRQLRAYFRSYAEHFEIIPNIEFYTRVLKAEPTESGQWRLQVQHQPPQSEQSTVRDEVFDYLFVASGHHWDPRMPHAQHPGTFSGRVMHSHDYKKAQPFSGQRVLVVGGGNSACDVAVETARVADKVCISMRRGQHIFPKFLLGGLPADVVYTWTLWIPRVVRQFLVGLMLWAWQGPYKRYGLQKPTVGCLEMHPTLNSELLYFIRHGEIFPRVGIHHFDGSRVHFVDGTSDDFDTIVYCTGYRTTFPFFDTKLLDWRDATAIPLYRKMMHGDYPNLFFMGLFQPMGCIWPLADYQARIAAKQITGQWKRPANVEMRRLIQHEMDHPHFQFSKQPRHATEVDYHQFRSELLAELHKCR